MNQTIFFEIVLFFSKSIYFFFQIDLFFSKSIHFFPKDLRFSPLILRLFNVLVTHSQWSKDPLTWRCAPTKQNISSAQENSLVWLKSLAPWTNHLDKTRVALLLS